MDDNQTTPPPAGAPAQAPAGSAPPAAAPASTPPAGGAPPAAPAADAGPDAWLAALAPDLQAQIQAHTGKLASALKTERDARRALEQQAKELAGQAAAGSDAQKQLQTLQAQLAATERRATFAEQAAGRVSDPALAWMAAERAGLVDAASGQVDLAKLQILHPALFTPAQTPAGPAVPPTNGQADGRGARALTRADVERMTAAEVSARWAEVEQVLRAAG